MSVDYQVDSFMDLLSENFLWTSTNLFAESSWKIVTRLIFADTYLPVTIPCLSYAYPFKVITEW